MHIARVVFDSSCKQRNCGNLFHAF